MTETDHNSTSHWHWWHWEGHVTGSEVSQRWP